jgi:glycosyltransferase involved in cell wall biosynthesis
MNAAPWVAVIIPARDAEATLAEALEALGAQRFSESFEVIVVDDGSLDATAQIAQDSGIVDQVVHAGGAGPGAARNAGAEATAADRLAFIDADCRPTPEWLASGVAALEAADLIVGETRPRPDRPCGPCDRTLSVIGCSPLFEGANLFVRRSLFDDLGGFESWLGPRDGKELGEDVWFGWRAVRRGARIAACPAALAHHEVFPRGPASFAAERWRLRFFPAMTRRVPELRRAAFHRRYFLNARQLRFDAAVLGVALASVTRRPVLAAAAFPYLQLLTRDLREPDGKVTAAARLSADVVALAALVVGTVRSRTLLL